MVTWPRHIDHFERTYDKAFVKDPLFGSDLIDRIHKCVQVFLHFCNTTSIKDVELGAPAEFGKLKKKLERGDYITTTPVWVDRPTPKEEGRRKSDGHGSRYRMSCGGGGRDSVHNIGVEPQLWIMERLGEMTSAVRSDNLRCFMEADGGEICLRYQSKGECVRHCPAILKGMSLRLIIKKSHAFIFLRISSGDMHHLMFILIWEYPTSLLSTL